MEFNYRATARFMCRQVIRLVWTTSQQKWTTSFLLAGMTLAAILMPPFGIVVFGTAFAGWWFAVLVMTVFFGLVGNRVGVGREKAAIKRQIDHDSVI
ncbi:hypothetical protein HJB84_22525 [Rhizobium sp. NZLR1b]|uniref:hypothetical protein n=1 Tax=Rhizobium sp. NZLR1b TaxID=2731099 RepID=UPI001C83FCB1|nr:hypothetical protein [Rhizobium sp. NZLR1b]MBX5172611.1 hypothetical protein [Rhizobium sp. NZLR1b]